MTKESPNSIILRSDVVRLFQERNLEDLQATQFFKKWLQQEERRLNGKNEPHIELMLDIEVAKMYQELGVNDVARKSFTELVVRAQEIGLIELSQELTREVENVNESVRRAREQS